MPRPAKNLKLEQRIEVAPGLMVIRVVPDGWQLPEFTPGQFAVLGLIFCAGGLTVNALVGALAGRARRNLSGRGRAAGALRYVAALVFAGLAARLALQGG